MSNKINVLHQTEGPVYGSVGRPLLLKIVVSTADFKDFIAEWKLNGVNVPAEQISDADQSLYIEEMRENQFGTYTCHIKLKDEPQVGVDIKPILVQRRFFIAPQDQSPTYIKKRIGEELTLFATPAIELGQHPEFQWYRNHIPVEPEKIEDNRTVHIARVGLIDFGNYTCRVTVRGEPASQYWINPIIVEKNDTPPVIHLNEEYPSSITVAEDSAVHLNVLVTSDDKVSPIEYTWIHNGRIVIEENGNSLAIPHIRKDQEGIWRLEVKQGDTTVYSKDCHIEVDSQPFFRITRQPQTLNVSGGALGLFSVDYRTNYSPVKIQWYRKKNAENEFTPIVGETNKDLHITPATTELNRARYKARITYGTDQYRDSEEAELLVGQALTIRITKQPQALRNVRVSSSQTITFEAETNYEHYRLDYQWYKDDELMPGKTSNVLHFSSIKKTDEGQYKCIASMGISGHRITAESSPAQVTVDNSKASLTITKQPTGATIRTGGSWSISVEANSNDALPIRYRWFKDGQDLFPQGVEQKNVYGEDHAQPDSTGVYTCRVSVGFGDHRASQMSHPARVLISDNVEIVPNDLQVTAHPHDNDVKYNQRVILTARSQNSIGLKPHIQWKKDGVAIHGANSETLVIEHAKPSDAGTYTAEITAAEKTVTTNPAVVTVAEHSNINILKHPVDVVAKEGQTNDIVLEAHAEHADGETEVSYQWHKIKDGVDTEIRDATNKTLVIPHAQISKQAHQATYYAEIKEENGHVKHSEKVRVVFTTAKLKRYVHPIPWRRTSFQYQGYWVMDEIDRCNREGLNWLEDFTHTKYPDEIETIAASLHHYSNTHVLESRNGYLVDGTQLF